jgi:hypothetical protein
MVMANTAEAACHGPELFQSRSIRELLRNYRGQMNPAPTLVPSPTAPQNLGELHDRMNDALAYALVRNQTVPSQSILATNEGNQNLTTFSSAQLLGVPTTVEVTMGRATESNVRIRYITEGGTNASCYYNKSANGTSFAFNYCAPTAYESICDGGWGLLCKTALNLGINAGDSVVARAVQLPLARANVTERLQAMISGVNNACGGLALTSVHLLQNLTCTAPNHVGLEVMGHGKYVVNGHGYAIKSPGSEIGLFVMGDNGVVEQLSVSNVAGGYGMMAYDTNGLQLVSNRFSQNLVGAYIYTDNANTTKIVVKRNDMSGNAFSALIFSGDGKQTDNPQISSNDFGNTGGYAISIDAKNASFSGAQDNYYNGSKDALYLLNGNFSVSNLDLSKSGALGPQIFADSAASLSVSNTNLTYSATAAQSQERTALHLYRVGSVNVSGLTVTNSDVAFKATTENGTSTAINLTNSTLTGATTAAVMLQSWDSTIMGKTVITGNNLSGAPANYSIWQVNNIALGAGSNILGNTLNAVFAKVAAAAPVLSGYTIQMVNGRLALVPVYK